MRSLEYACVTTNRSVGRSAPGDKNERKSCHQAGRAKHHSADSLSLLQEGQEQANVNTQGKRRVRASGHGGKRARSMPASKQAAGRAMTIPDRPDRSST